MKDGRKRERDVKEKMKTVVIKIIFDIRVIEIKVEK